MKYFENIFKSDCFHGQQAILGFQYNSTQPVDAINGTPKCGYPLASGFTGSSLTIGTGSYASQITNDTIDEKGLIIQGNNSSGEYTTIIKNNLKIQGNSFLSGNLHVDGKGTFQNIHTHNLTSSGIITGTEMQILKNTILNTLTIKGDAVFEKNIIMSGGSLRAKKGAPSAGNASIEGYSFGEDGDTGIFAINGNKMNGSDVGIYLDGTPKITIKPNTTTHIGIGLNNPSHGLVVSHSGSDVAHFISNSLQSAHLKLSVGNNINKRIELINRDNGKKTSLWNPITHNVFNIVHMNGRIGIGTDAPTAKLHVNGDMRVENGLTVTGSGVSAPSFFYTSDLNKKKNIQLLSSSLEKIKKLHGYSFQWKDTHNMDIGLIAQEVEQVFPELIGINTDNNGNTYKMVKYGNLIAPLINAINELSHKLERQEERINQQEKHIQMLMQRIEAQEKIIQSLQ